MYARFVFLNMSSLHAYTVVLLSALSICAPVDRTEAATFDTASKAIKSTRFVGTGWMPNEAVDLRLGGADGTVLGTVRADSKGNIDVSVKNTDSRAASIRVGSTLTLGFVGGVTATTQVVLDPEEHAWIAPPGVNVGPLTNQITDTELLSAGFEPSFISIISISSNAHLISESSIFDSNIDAITTSGFYDLLAEGPVSATYNISGAFTNLYDLATGDKLPRDSDSVQYIAQIGTVKASEPSAFVLFGTGVLFVIGYSLGLFSRQRNRARSWRPTSSS